MRCVVLGVSLLLALGPALAAADDKPDKTDPSPAEEVKKLIADYQKELEDFYKLYGEAKTDEEKKKLVDEKMPKPDKIVPRLLELAEKNPKDAGVVPDALIWVVTQGSFGADGAKSKDKALEQLTQHIDNPKVADICPSLVYSPSRKGETLMRAILDKGPSDETKGKAAYSLGQYLKNMAESARTLKEEPDQAKDYEAAYGKDIIKQLQDSDPAAMVKEAEKLFVTVGEKYGSVQVYNRPLSEMVEGELFEIRELAIGKIAPDIEGEDLDGNKLKLSEYRGKVVVLDFWGNW